MYLLNKILLIKHIYDIYDLIDHDDFNVHTYRYIIELKQFIQNNIKLQEKINNELNNNIWPRILNNI